MALFELDGVRVKTPGPGRYYVAESATVIGNVEIGDDCSIWFNSVVRADNDKITIGAGSNIQDNCVLHVDPGFPIVLGEAVAVGHMALLHGCTVNRGCLIGMGAVVMNGAVIGEDTLVGARTLISEGTIIPPRSLVIGSPGKVIRTLTDEQIAKFQRGVDNYRRNWRKYAASMKLQAE